MKTKEYYTKDHTENLDLTNDMPDPEYGPDYDLERFLTKRMKELDKEWKKIYKGRKEFEESLDNCPF